MLACESVWSSSWKMEKVLRKTWAGDLDGGFPGEYGTKG